MISYDCCRAVYDHSSIQIANTSHSTRTDIIYNYNIFLFHLANPCYLIVSNRRPILPGKSSNSEWDSISRSYSSIEMFRKDPTVSDHLSTRICLCLKKTEYKHICICRNVYTYIVVAHAILCKCSLSMLYRNLEKRT